MLEVDRGKGLGGGGYGADQLEELDPCPCPPPPEVLTKPQLWLLSQASGCALQDKVEKCSDKYRTITGRCNNK